MNRQRIKELLMRAEVYAFAAGLLALIYALVVYSNIAGIRIYSVNSERGAFYTVSVPVAMAAALLCMAVSALFLIRRYSPSQRTHGDEDEKAEVTVIPKAETAAFEKSPEINENMAQEPSYENLAASESKTPEERYLRGGAAEGETEHGELKIAGESWSAVTENHRTKKCIRCSEPLEADAKFCSNCGAITGQWVKEEG